MERDVEKSSELSKHNVTSTMKYLDAEKNSLVEKKWPPLISVVDSSGLDTNRYRNPLHKLTVHSVYSFIQNFVV